jgi:tripartite-type tricarboxylate transporter receptor subunit TctC
MISKLYLRIMILLSLALIINLSGSQVLGASFPEKPVRFIVNFRAGSGVDNESRGIAPYVQKYLGVPLLLENVEGASGKIGLTKAWRATSDGYTWVIQDNPLHLIGEFVLFPEYRMLDFTYIYAWSRTNQVLVVNSESWKTLDELINAGRGRTLSVGLPGKGTASELSVTMLAEGVNIRINPIPFDGGGEALASLAGKHVDFAVTSSTSALPLVRSGKIKPLLVFGNSPDVVYPNVPLPKDLGHKFTVMPMLRGISGPPRMDEKVVMKIEEAFSKATKDPGFVDWARTMMMEIAPLNHVEFRNAIEIQKKELEKYKSLFK